MNKSFEVSYNFLRFIGMIVIILVMGVVGFLVGWSHTDRPDLIVPVLEFVVYITFYLCCIIGIFINGMMIE
jgi:hypothetical protein